MPDGQDAHGEDAVGRHNRRDEHSGATRRDEPAPAADGVPRRGPTEKRHMVLAFVATCVVIVLATGVGSLIVDVPPSLPTDAPSVLLWLAGAVLLTIAALVATFFTDVRNRLAVAFVGLPGRLREKLRRRPTRLIVFLGSLMAAVLIAALVPGPNEAPVGLETGTIKLLTAFDLSPSDPRRTLINQWNEGHPTSKVEVIDAPGQPDQQHDRMVNDATGAREADVYLLDNIWMAEFIARGYIRPVDESTRQSKDVDFFRNVMTTCRDTAGGKAGLWGLPLNADAGLMFRRSGLNGVDEPESWDDYAGDAARTAIRGLRGTGTEAGRPRAADAAQFGDAEILTVTAFEAMWAADGEVVNQDGRPVLNADRSAVVFDEQAKEGLKRLATAYADDDITAPDARSDDDNGAFTRFKRGDTLFMRNWAVTYDRLKSSADKVPVPFEVSALPHTSVLGGQNLAMSSATERPRAAQAFMEFLVSAPSQLILLNVGGFASSRPAVYQEASSITRPYANDLRSVVERARPRPVAANYIRFSREFRLGIGRALRNRGEYESDFPNKLAAALGP